MICSLNVTTECGGVRARYISAYSGILMAI